MKYPGGIKATAAIIAVSFILTGCGENKTEIPLPQNITQSSPDSNSSDKPDEASASVPDASGVTESSTDNSSESVTSETNTDVPTVATERGYDYETMIASMESELGMNSSDMGYLLPWCTFWLTAHLRAVGVDVSGGYACDVVVTALNNGIGEYYSFRKKNTDSLPDLGLSDEGMKLVHQVSRKDVTPERGDIILYRWVEDEEYNWSHVGVVKDYDPKTKTIFTIEGNTLTPEDDATDDPIIEDDDSRRHVENRERAYDANVVGILRI